MPSIYIINPAPDEPSYYTYEVLGGPEGGWVQVADLTIATLAAFVPGGWSIRLADEAIAPVDLEAQVDFVAITGKVTQRGRMIALAAAFRARGVPVLIGGSFASLSPAEMRPHADILVTGEIEEIAAGLFDDLAAGTWADHYEGGRADVRLAPLPRWDIYPVDRALTGAVQTTRGCPFNCEFCDVIQYQGRKQRHKDIGQVIGELDLLYEVGFRRIFIVDDNFTVHRSWCRTVLDALTDWNAARGHDPVVFITQASMDIARDEDILDRLRAAGVTMLFMGVETINEESLRETGKRQNLLMPALDAVRRIVSRGIGIHAGIIVGFDHDGPQTFEAMKAFFADSPLPELGVGVLVAPEATDLYRRLEREGRLAGAIWETGVQGPFSTNISPLRMSREALLDGTLDLARSAFDPEAYQKRMLAFIDMFGSAVAQDEVRRLPARSNSEPHPRSHTFYQVVHYISSLGEAEARMIRTVLRAATSKPASFALVTYYLSHYAQARYFLMRDPCSFDRPASGSDPRQEPAMSASALARPPAPGAAAQADPA